jgi:single-strand DNA-binding protein
MMIGNIARDVELKCTSSGVAVATTSIALNESWKDQDGNTKEKVTFVNVVAWKKIAEIMAEYLKKGSKVYLEGKISTRNYDDKEGKKVYVTEVVVDQLLMLDGKNSSSSTTQSSASAPVSNTGDTESDLPF